MPRWMKDQKVTGGWITAEYSMLPYSTLQRKQRDITKGKIDGRSGNPAPHWSRHARYAGSGKLGARTICVDCDVLQSRRWHSHRRHHWRVCGARHRHPAALLAAKTITENPILHAVAAVRHRHREWRKALLDLCYTEDVGATVDFNMVMNSAGEFIELQGTGEEATFSETQLAELIKLGKAGVRQLLEAQEKAPGTGVNLIPAADLRSSDQSSYAR